MVSTRTRGSAGGGPLLAGLVISFLMVGTASSWTQPAQDEPDYPHVTVQSVSCGGWNTAEFFRTASLETVTVCLGQGAGVGPQGASAMTPLHWAAGVGAPSPVVDALIAHGGDPNARDRSDATPLHAATTGSAELVATLLAGGADPDAQDRFGWSPLHQAVSTGNPDVMRTLLANGADPDASAMWGETPLHMAVSAVHESVAAVGVLLAGGADPEALTEDGRTPLHTAALSSADPSTIRVLVASGANPRARMPAGWTPLHLAARFNRSPEVVRALLDGGADPMVRDDHGRLPADLARQNAALSGTDVLERLAQVAR